MFFLFDMQEEWTWNISNNYIIKSDGYIKLKYIQISLGGDHNQKFSPKKWHFKVTHKNDLFKEQFWGIPIVAMFDKILIG